MPIPRRYPRSPSPSLFPARTTALLAIVLPVMVTLFWAAASRRPALAATTESERRILGVMDEIVRSGKLYANVPPADGRLLRLMAEAVNAKLAVEIGTSTGISGLWLCLALEKTGGKLYTFEFDARRAATAREHFLRAGVASIVTLVEGDAHQTLRQVSGPIDLAFIDADKEGYVDYLNQLLPKIRPGGVILAHNSGMVPDYVAAVKANPDLETVLFTQGGGMVVSLKKR